MKLTKIIGLIVLTITEILILILFYLADVPQKITVLGYQMIVFGSFWGVKALADNLKTLKGGVK